MVVVVEIVMVVVVEIVMVVVVEIIMMSAVVPLAGHLCAHKPMTATCT